MGKRGIKSSRFCVLAICLFLLTAINAGCGGKRGGGASSGAPIDAAGDAAAVDDQGNGISLADLAAGEPPAAELADGPRDAYAAIVGVPPAGAAGGPGYSGYYKTNMAFDGDPRTWWAGERNKAAWDLYYGLPSAIALTQLTVNFYSSQYTPTDIKLYTSTDGTTWAVSGQISNPTSKPSFTLASVSAKYIRIEMTGNPPTGIPIIREIDWLPAAVKPGASAGPNYNDDWYFASNAFDGNPKTWWAGKANAGAWDVFYNFGTPRQVGLLTAAFYAINTRPTTVSLYTSGDGITWTKTGDLSPEATSTIYVGAAAQYVRISMAGNPPSTFPLLKDIYFDALPGAASPDSFNSNYRAENAFDNRPASLWAGKKGAAEWNLYYNYPKPNGINTVTVHYTDAAHTPNATTLFTSYDGAIWTQVGTFPAGTDTSVTVNDYAKHLRFKLETATATAAFFPTIKDIDITNITATPSVELSQVQVAIQAAGANWTAGETPVSALAEPERVRLLGALPETASAPRLAMRNALAAGVLPYSFDWRNKDGADWTTPVRNQSSCGSCVAFAALGALESEIKISNNNPLMSVDLSESDLFSCGGAACGVGWYPSSAADRLKSVGVVDEACLAYQPVDGVCSLKCAGWASRVTKIDSWNYVPADRAAIKNYILQGPVTAAVRVYNDFFYYRGGVYRRTSNLFAGRHAMTIVGWSDADQAWIVRNSWGAGWGEKGYIRIKYGEIEIEGYVLAMQKSGSTPAGVVASVSPTAVTLSGGTANATLTCAANGTVTSLEGRCDTTGAWTAITSGSTKTCSYTTAGTYTPGCRVNGAITSSVTTPVTVTAAVNQPPVATISANPASSSAAPATVAFTGGCTDSDGTCVSYSWNFGDGSPTASSQNPSHTFNSAGTYAVTLTVTDNNGAAAQAAYSYTAGSASLHNHKIASFYRLTCAITPAGGVKCWGTGRLGNGAPTGDTNITPQNVIGLSSGVISVVAGMSHVCALTDAGGVKCWGNNSDWQLGNNDIYTSYNTPISVPGLSSGVKSISASNNLTCALTNAGGVKCWGSSFYVNLGSPQDIPGLTSGVAQIAAGMYHMCALTSAGGVKCWGDNRNGQLGDGVETYEPPNSLVDVAGLTSGVVAISSTSKSSCALTSAGGVKCWGDNGYGQIGDGTFTKRTTPVNVSGLTSGVAELISNGAETCARTTAGVLKCWGGNPYGQLGTGDTLQPSTPVDLTSVPGSIADITFGGQHSCAITTTGVVYCWGQNGDGQLAVSTLSVSYRLTPGIVSGF